MGDFVDAPASSIHDLEPLEAGGTVARQGFTFQDHVAAGFCLQMLEVGSQLAQVWCESHDDITLIWSTGTGDAVEFVQVKASEPNQLWSPYLLYRPGEGGQETSVLGRSLAQDRCSEAVSFRIVTARPCNDELEPLESPLGSADRAGDGERIEALKETLRDKAPDLRSPNNNSTDHWVDNAVWDARHDEERLRLANKALIQALAEAAGEILVADQIEEVHQRLLALVKQAAERTWTEGGVGKKIDRASFQDWFSAAVEKAAHPARAGIAANLRAKMEAAGLAEDEIVSASDLRRRYRQSVLSPKYIAADERQIVEGEVQALLSRQRSMLDTGGLEDSGVEFHARCLRELHAMRVGLVELRGIEDPPPEHLLQGFMYNLVDRCPHRFVEARP